MLNTKKQQKIMEVVFYNRKKTLLKLGFNSYFEYLKSDLWKGIKSSVLNDNPYCFSCGERATLVHHSSYKESTLKGETIKHLYSVCRGCHYKCEFGRKNGKKLNPSAATIKLSQMAITNGKYETSKDLHRQLSKRFEDNRLELTKHKRKPSRKAEIAWAAARLAEIDRRLKESKKA